MNQFIFGSVRYANGEVQHVDAAVITKSIMECMGGAPETSVSDIRIFFKSDKGNTIKVSFDAEKMKVLVNDDEQ